jgi:tRNA (cmo5U34)-methyltransferase
MSEKPEEMSKFFDDRATGYDEHMHGMFQDFDSFYIQISNPIIATDKAVKVLDLGCGTGNQLKSIFQKLPNARVTAIDLSEKMLKKLKEKYPSYLKQIEIVQGSYLTFSFSNCLYDYVVSVYSLHHFTKDVKRNLYEKIRKSLKPEGMYIEGDCVVSADKEAQLLANYQQVVTKELSNDLYHVDIPCSLQTQINLLQDAGFSKVDVIYHNEEKEVAIIVAQV